MLNRNLILLVISQAFSMASGATVVLVGGLVGMSLSPSPVLATLPVTLAVIGTALSTIPASLTMKMIGRKRGFICGALLASVAAFAAAIAIELENFYLFCCAIVFIGSSIAFAQQYRFAAAESVPAHKASEAISFILLGGIAAAIIGPQMASLGKDLTAIPYQGSFYALACLTLIPVALLFFYQETDYQDVTQSAGQRKLKDIFFTTGFIVAVGSSAVGYAVMGFIMTATPISMHHIDQHSFADTTWVIQWHVVAMFLPSLFSGRLVSAWGTQTIMLLGIFAMFLCILLAISSHSMLNYWSALVLLGIGWNFLFVAGTAKLTRHHRPEERFKAQAANDFCVFTAQAIASLSAGWALHLYGWQQVNLLCIPILLLMLLAIGYERAHLRKGNIAS